MDLCDTTMRPEGRRRLLIAVIFVIIGLLRIFREDQEISRADYANHFFSSSTKLLLPKCTKEASNWEKPNSLTSTKYERILQAEKILAFLISKLDEIGAPIILIFGTALKEFRNDTGVLLGDDGGPCLRPDYNDKDFDIAVFPEHFHYIMTLEIEILYKFNWVFKPKKGPPRLYTAIKPAMASLMDVEYQIDIYGFHCSRDNDLIYFPWDKITIEKSALLPAQKHKLILLPQHNDNDSLDAAALERASNDATTKSGYANSNISHHPGFYMPFNTPCFLHNMYGSDYMFPRSGKSSQAKWGTGNGRRAFYNPRCNDKKQLTIIEDIELNRQLAFCSGDIPKMYDRYRSELQE